MFSDPEMQWAVTLMQRTDLPDFERVVLAATMDYAIVKKEHFSIFAEDLTKFVLKYGTARYHDGKWYTVVCHLIKWAEVFRTSTAEAISFYHTSVGENLWTDWDDEKDQPLPYDLNKDTKHFEVYSIIDKCQCNCDKCSCERK